MYDQEAQEASMSPPSSIALSSSTELTRWDGQMSNASVSSFWEIGESEHRGVQPWPSQTNLFKIDTFHFLARRLALLR